MRRFLTASKQLLMNLKQLSCSCFLTRPSTSKLIHFTHLRKLGETNLECYGEDAVHEISSDINAKLIKGPMPCGR